MTTWFGQNIEVQVAFDDSPFVDVDSCTWYNLGDYVRGITINRGRTTELATYAPGTASVVFDNRTRLFDGSNTAGTFYGKLLPMRRIRIRVGLVAIFTGYVLGWPIEYPGMKDSTVTVSCVDGLRALEQAALPATAYEAEVLADSPSAYWRLDALDDSLTNQAIAGGIDMVSYPSPVVDASLTTVQPTTLPVGASSVATFYAGAAIGAPTVAPKSVEGWVSDWNIATPSDPVSIRVASSTTDYIRIIAAAGATTISVGYSNAADSKSLATTDTGVPYTAGPTHVALTASSTTLTLYVNGVSVWSSALGAGTIALSLSFIGTFADGQSVDDVERAVYGLATYSSTLSAARVSAHHIAGITAYGHPMGERTGERIDRCLDAIGWSPNDSTLSTGQTVCGTWLPTSRSALSVIRECEATEQGLFFIAKNGSARFLDRQWIRTVPNGTVQFSDDGSTVFDYTDVQIDASVADFVRNVVNVSYPNGSVTVKDQTSITAYLPQSDSVGARALPNFSAYLARQLGAMRLRERKDPATRVASLAFKPLSNPATLVVVANSLELGDQASVKRTPNGATDPIEEICVVQGIRQRFDRTGEWDVTLYLAPATDSYTEAPYLVVGDATYGKIGAADGNLVPY